MAVALSWQGYVDTDLDFAEFFAQDHTIVARFMPQFPNCYEGPVIAENGTGTFGFGQADFLPDPEGTKLYLAVGTQQIVRAAALTAGTWHYLAVAVRVSATDRTFSMFLDGMQLGGSLTVASTDGQLPTGTLRFGKRTTGQTVNDHDAQVYGLLDDIAVFTRALPAAEIRNLQDSVPQLTGDEADLLAGYTFAAGELPGRLARPVTCTARPGGSTPRPSGAAPRTRRCCRCRPGISRWTSRSRRVRHGR